MAKTYEELLAGATQIKNNELPESNTHSLVGGQLVDMVEKQKEDSERIDNVSKSHKGYFQTLEQLKAKYPSPKDGETAWVGEPYPGNVYDVVSGSWHDTGVPAQEGSGGGGTTDYNALENRPAINNVTLAGNKTLDELDIASKQSVEALVIPIVDSSLSTTSPNAIQNKVVTTEINKINSSITSQDSKITQIQSQVSGLSGIDSPFIGYFDSSASLPSVSSPCWALVGDLASVKPYAYYTTAPSGFSVGWNDLSVALKTYDFTNIENYKLKTRAFSVAGKGDDYEYAKAQVVPGNIYKISFERLWAFASSASNISYMSIYYQTEDGDLPTFIDIKPSNKAECPLVYSCKIPEDIKKDNCNLYVGGRADVGEYINFEIENITDLVLATQDTMLLEQGALNASTGAEEDNANRVRTSTYVEGGRTIISYGNVLIWLVVYFDDSLSFVKALNPKNQLYTLESGYKAKVVFANEGGTTAITPADVYGESTAYLLSSGTNKSSNSNTTKSLKLEHGIYYNTPRIGVSSQSYSDLKPSSKIGRETFLLAKKTPNYIGGGSISIKTTANIIIHEFNNDGTYLASNFYPSTELVKTSGSLIKITAIPGSLVNHSLSSGSISSSGTNTSQDNRLRSDYVDIDTFDFILIPKNEKLALRCYNSSKTYIAESESMPYLFESNCGCIAASHIKMYYADVKYVRVIVGNVDDSTNFDGIDFYTAKSAGEVGEISITSNSLGEIVKDFSEYGETTCCYYDTEVNLPAAGQNYYGKILIKTPKNYNNRGDKVPVVLFKSGSGTFNEMSVYTFYYDTYIQYLVDCGFVVFDYHAGTSKYPTTDGFGTPTNIMAAHCAWDYVCEHYNVDESKLFIACKSLGGDIAAILSFSGLPVRAVGMLAPALNPARWCFGYTKEEQQVYAEDFGFEGDWQTVLDGSRDYTRESFKTLLTQNIDKLAGHLPMQLGVTNKMFEDLIVNQDVYNPDTEGTFDGVIRVLKVPTKIWAAPDDTNTSINMHKNYIKSAQNGCSKAIMREMPEGTGGHHSVDNDPSAPQTTDITTRLGIHYDIMTTAWVELADWFIGHGG